MVWLGLRPAILIHQDAIQGLRSAIVRLCVRHIGHLARQPCGPQRVAGGVGLEFFDPPQCPFFSYPLGSPSPYFEQAAVLLRRYYRLNSGSASDPRSLSADDDLLAFAARCTESTASMSHLRGIIPSCLGFVVDLPLTCSKLPMVPSPCRLPSVCSLVEAGRLDPAHYAASIFAAFGPGYAGYR